MEYIATLFNEEDSQPILLLKPIKIVFFNKQASETPVKQNAEYKKKSNQ